MSDFLFLSSAFLPLLYVIYSVAQFLRGRTQLDAPGSSLAIVGLVGVLMTSIVGALRGADSAIIAISIGVSAGVVLFISLVLVLLQSRKPGASPGQSFALLGFFLGALLIVSIFSTPLILSAAGVELETSTANVVSSGPAAQPAANRPAPGQEFDGMGDLPAQATAPFIEESATPSPTPLPSSTPPLTETRLPAATPTPSRTPFRYASPTPNPTLAAAAGTACELYVTTGLNMRAAPGLDAQVIDTVPAGTYVMSNGATADAAWWRVVYEDQVGWLGGQYIVSGELCRDLPPVTE